MSNYPPQPGMPQQPPYGPPGGQQPPPQQGSGCFSCMGCGLITLVVLLLVCGIGGWYVANNWKGMVAGAVAGIFKQIINESKLPEQQKAGINTQIDRIVTAFNDGKLTEEKLKQFGEEMEKSPLLPAIFVAGADLQYIEKSGLTDAEKQEARTTLNRLMSGVFSKQIPQDKLQSLNEMIIEEGPNNQKKLKERLSDEELKEFVAEAKTLADEAMIPAEVPAVDYAAEVKKIVDKVLGE